MQASVCAPATTRWPTPALGQDVLELGVLEGVAVVLVHERLGVESLELVDVLPAVAAVDEALVAVLHPDDRDL